MERAVIFGENKSLVGILHQPVGDAHPQYPVIILINGGIIHRVGPNRLYVKLARALQEVGWTSLRFDLSGLGDSPKSLQRLDSGNDIHDVKQAMDFIEASKGIHEFILMGICSGADIAFNTALKDDRVVGVVPVNGYFYEVNEMSEVLKKAKAAVAMRYYKKNMLSMSRWLKIIQGKSGALRWKNIVRIANSMLQFIHRKIKPRKLRVTKDGKTDPSKFTIRNWKVLVKRNTRLFHIFSEGSDSHDVFTLTAAAQLKGYIQGGIIDYTLIEDADHTCTPVWSQGYLITLIKDWLKKNTWRETYTSSSYDNRVKKETLQDLLMPNL
jgi:dienelactone hydrolase